MLCCVLGIAVLAAIGSVLRAPLEWWRGGIRDSSNAFPPSARFGLGEVDASTGAVR
ncbi:hypothetical protein J2W56_002040 [Nocardia kruczakiae]|uniref:Uncharacterized protein n=1 Tax=Nocardia kruczakiae TaxID=261477 RepID=A0ABU1XCW1_9NOCA|nr:hypothetical protein [Nocardia kruczakiae]